jgi:hypothetical protein
MSPDNYLPGQGILLELLGSALSWQQACCTHVLCSMHQMEHDSDIYMSGNVKGYILEGLSLQKFHSP